MKLVRKKLQRWLVVIVLLVTAIGVFVLPRIDANNRVTKAMQYYDIAERMGAKYGVRTARIIAIIAAESGGNPKAISRSGANGAMQVTTGTGRGIARALGKTDYTNQSLFDPEINIEFGTYYYAQNVARYDGDEDLALAAYNAGPGGADRYKRSGTLPRETQRYIPTVKSLEALAEQAIAERNQPTSLLPEGETRTGVKAGLVNWLSN